MGAAIEQLILKLSDFRARSGAIRQLVQAGDAAVAPLINALQTAESEGARWAALECLGELRARQAVGQIAPLLEDSRYRSAAHDALVKIAGEDLGPVAQAWLRWSREGGAAGQGALLDPELHMTGLPDERLMQLALKGTGAAFRKDAEGRYTVQVPLSGSAGQELTVHLAQKDQEGSPIAIVYADCGEARKEYYESALKRNLKMPYGTLALRESRGGTRFVMFNAILREDMSAMELRKSILAIADRAVQVRRDLESGAKSDTGDSTV